MVFYHSKGSSKNLDHTVVGLVKSKKDCGMNLAVLSRIRDLISMFVETLFIGAVIKTKSVKSNSFNFIGN